MNGDLDFLQEWFHSNCDGDWEHDLGIEIATLDNPGWYFKANLVGTALEGRLLSKVAAREDQPTWLIRWSDGATFEAACGPLGLSEVLDEFRRFAEVRRGEAMSHPGE